MKNVNKTLWYESLWTALETPGPDSCFVLLIQYTYNMLGVTPSVGDGDV